MRVNRVFALAMLLFAFLFMLPITTDACPPAPGAAFGLSYQASGAGGCVDPTLAAQLEYQRALALQRSYQYGGIGAGQYGGIGAGLGAGLGVGYAPRLLAPGRAFFPGRAFIPRPRVVVPGVGRLLY